MMNIPDTSDANHGLLKVFVGLNTICGIQHGLHLNEGSGLDGESVRVYLTCTLILCLGDTPAVAIHDRLLTTSCTSTERARRRR
jgi:hypothetical protein